VTTLHIVGAPLVKTDGQRRAEARDRRARRGNTVADRLLRDALTGVLLAAAALLLIGPARLALLAFEVRSLLR
jgi:UPF0716 family protein affecting phage T7 exclusion